MINTDLVNTAKINGISMDYITFGTGDKNMVVIPGLSIKKVTQSAASLKNTFRIFTKNFTITILDVNDNITPGYKIHNLAEDTVSVLKYLKIEEAYFYGHSLGGMIMQDILVNHSELVIKGVLSSTVSHVNNDEAIVLNWLNLAEAQKGRELAESMLDAIFSEQFLNKFRELLLSMYREITPEEFAKISTLTNACRGFDLTNELKALSDNKKASMMVIGAKGDKVFAIDQIIELADLLECKRYIYGSMQAHSVCDEDPLFYNHVLDFFTSFSSDLPTR